MKCFTKMWLAATLLLLLASCSSKMNITYLQNEELIEEQAVGESFEIDINKSYEVKIKPDDMIGILVNSRDPELANMFNLPMISYQTDTKVVGQNRVLGYLVDQEGNINFPQLGTIHVEDMTRSQLTKYITDKLKGDGLVNDAVVTVQLLNFRVSVIGEVNMPGSFEVSSDRITIFDALSQAGDMTIFGERNSVKVIREENGKRNINTVDLRSRKILESPFYYLQQNDVVYVEPNKVRAGQSEINQNRTISTWASIVSVILSALSLAFTL